MGAAAVATQSTGQMQAPLVLEQLTDLEIKAFGEAITWVKDPDLSMFLPDERGRILRHSLEYVSEQLESRRMGIEAALAPYAGSVVKMALLENVRSSSEETIMGSRFKEPHAAIAFYLALGNQERARATAKNSARSDNLFYDLEYVLKSHELAENRGLAADEVREISERYLMDLHNVGSSRFMGFWKAHKSREITPILKKNDETLWAVLSGANGAYYTINQAVNGDEFRRQYSELEEAFTGMVQGLLTEKEQYPHWARKCLEEGQPLAAALLNGHMLKSYSPERDTHLRNALEALAQSFISQGHLLRGKRIQDKLGIPFDYEFGFRAFVDYVTSKKSIREISHRINEGVPQHQMIGALIQADTGTLKRFAEESTRIIEKHHEKHVQHPAEYRLSAWPYLYLFASIAYNKLGDEQQEKKIDGLYTAIKEEARPQSHPLGSSAASAKQPKSRTSLEKLFLSDPGYVEAAWKAYDENGLFGIRDLNRERVDKMGKEERESALLHHVDPISIIDNLFKARGMTLEYWSRDKGTKISEDVTRARQAILQYELVTGDFQGGLGMQVFHAFLEGNLNLPNPEHYAMNVVSTIGQGLATGYMTPRDGVSTAERFATLIPGSRIPEGLYRLTAAKALRDNAEEAYPHVADARHQPVSWTSALTHYRKLGHQGLIHFVERNFGTF